VFKLDVYPTGPDGKLIFTAESAAAVCILDPLKWPHTDAFDPGC